MNYLSEKQIIVIKRSWGFILFFLSVGAVYSAGVYSRMPQGIVQIGGMEIVKQTLLDAAITMTYASLICRFFIFALFPTVFQTIRAAIQMLAVVRLICFKMRILRLTSQVLHIVDYGYIAVSDHPGRAALFLSFPTFGYLSTENTTLLLFSFMFPLLAFGLEQFNSELRAGKLRVKLRARRSPKLQEKNIDASLITVAMIFAFLVGSLRLEYIIQEGNIANSTDWHGPAVIVATTETGLILAEKVGPKQNFLERIWYFAPFSGAQVQLQVEESQ